MCDTTQLCVTRRVDTCTLWVQLPFSRVLRSASSNQRHSLCDMMHSYVWHDSSICVTPRIHMFGMAHWCVRHACKCVTWLIHTCAIWLIHVCDMTHSRYFPCDVLHSSVWLAWFTCVTWLIRMCDMTLWLHSPCYLTHPYVWHDSFACVTWLIQQYCLRDTSHLQVWHDSFIGVTWRIHMCDTLFQQYCLRDTSNSHVQREVGGWGRDPKKCTGRDWGMGSSTI